MTDRDERIREIAYFLWLDEGSPDGGAERHWFAAEGLIGPETDEDQEARVEGELPPEPTKQPSSMATAGSD